MLLLLFIILLVVAIVMFPREMGATIGIILLLVALLVIHNANQPRAIGKVDDVYLDHCRRENLTYAECIQKATDQDTKNWRTR